MTGATDRPAAPVEGSTGRGPQTRDIAFGVPRPPRRNLRAALFYGFAISLAMWVAGFLAKINGGWLSDGVLLAMLMCIPLWGGFCCGRRTAEPRSSGEGRRGPSAPAGRRLACGGLERQPQGPTSPPAGGGRGANADRSARRVVTGPAWLLVAAAGRGRSGASAGLIAGLVNLLVLLSVVGDQGGSLLWVPGSVLLHALLGGIGGFGGGFFRKSWDADWRLRFTSLACGAVLFLILIGGLVTTLEVGLAVPDWPNTYGYLMFLFPLSKMVGGIYYEHAHRLFGSLVGLITIVLAVWTWREEDRGWVRFHAAALLGLVIGQGVLGGLRVVRLETELAVVHAVAAQSVFALTGALALFLSPAWRSGERVEATWAARLRPLSVLLAGTVLLQIVSGAILRHFGWGLSAHLLLAAAVLASAAALAQRVLSHWSEVPWLSQLGVGLLVLVICQLMLGLGSWMFWTIDSVVQPSLIAVLVTTAHVVLGATIMALATMVMLLVFRYAAAGEAEAPGAVRAGLS